MLFSGVVQALLGKQPQLDLDDVILHDNAPAHHARDTELDIESPATPTL